MSEHRPRLRHTHTKANELLSHNKPTPPTTTKQRTTTTTVTKTLKAITITTVKKKKNNNKTRIKTKGERARPSLTHTGLGRRFNATRAARDTAQFSSVQIFSICSSSCCSKRKKTTLLGICFPLAPRLSRPVLCHPLCHLLCHFQSHLLCHLLTLFSVEASAGAGYVTNWLAAAGTGESKQGRARQRK